jgi:hypothetical protein
LVTVSKQLPVFAVARAIAPRRRDTPLVMRPMLLYGVSDAG